MSKRPGDTWSGNVGNDRRRAKMRTLTLDDETWSRLGELAEEAGVSRSAAVESLVLKAAKRASKKVAEGA